VTVLDGGLVAGVVVPAPALGGVALSAGGLLGDWLL
jgi:hypothetical protein